MNFSDELGTIYYRGLSTKSMTKLNELVIESDRDVCFEYAIVQQVRSGVVIRTYYVPLDPALNAHLSPVGGTPYRSEQYEEKQVISLQFSEDTPETALVENLTDVAVGFTYNTTTDIDTVTYESAFVFLTDQQIKKIFAGQRIDVEFKEHCVKDIKQITLVSTDVINANVNCAYATTFRADSDGKPETLKNFSFSQPVRITRNKQNVPADDPKRENVADLTLTVRFDEEKMTSQMLKDRISATIGYTDYMGDTEIFRIEDVTKFATSSGEMKKDGITVNVLVPGLISLKYVKLEPHSVESGLSAGLPVTTVDAEWIVNGEKLSVPRRNVDRMIEEGEGYSVNLADVDVLCDVFVMKEDDSVKFSRSISSRDYDLTLGETEYIVFKPQVTNSTEGFEVEAESVSGNCTYKMTQDKNEYVFRPEKPEQDESDPDKTESAKDTVYRITVTSKEMPNIKVTLNVTYKVS